MFFFFSLSTKPSIPLMGKVLSFLIVFSYKEFQILPFLKNHLTPHPSRPTHFTVLPSTFCDPGSINQTIKHPFYKAHFTKPKNMLRKGHVVEGTSLLSGAFSNPVLGSRDPDPVSSFRTKSQWMGTVVLFAVVPSRVRTRRLTHVTERAGQGWGGYTAPT